MRRMCLSVTDAAECSDFAHPIRELTLCPITTESRYYVKSRLSWLSGITDCPLRWVARHETQARRTSVSFLHSKHQALLPS